MRRAIAKDLSQTGGDKGAAGPETAWQEEHKAGETKNKSTEKAKNEAGAVPVKSRKSGKESIRALIEWPNRPLYQTGKQLVYSIRAVIQIDTDVVIDHSAEVDGIVARLGGYCRWYVQSFPVHKQAWPSDQERAVPIRFIA